MPGARWLGELPIYRETALLKYLPPVVEFALAILAGQAISGLSTRHRATLPLVAAALLFAALAGALWLQADLSIDTAVLNRCLALLALFAATPCLVVLLRDAFRLGPWLLCLGLLASLLMEVNLRNSDVGRSVRCHPYNTPPMLEFLAQQAGPCRIGSLGALTPNIAMAHGIDDVRYVAGLSPVRRHLYRRHFFTQADQREALYFLGWEGLAFNRYYNLLNTRYYICVAAGPQGAADQKTERPQWDNGAPGDAKQFELVYQNEVRIYRNNWAYPRAFVVYRAEMAPHLTAADEILGRGDFDPSRQVVVEGARPDDWDAELFSAQPPPPGRPADEVVRTGASSLRIKARTERAGILVVSELYFPGWNAYVNGKRVPMLAADVMLRGVYLEPGEHVVEMRYQPRSFRYGLRLAGLAMLILFGLTLCRWRRRPEAGENQP